MLYTGPAVVCCPTRVRKKGKWKESKNLGNTRRSTRWLSGLIPYAQWVREMGKRKNGREGNSPARTTEYAQGGV